MQPPAPELPYCSQREHRQCLPDPVTPQNPPRARPSGTLPGPGVRVPLGVESLGCSQPSVTPLVGPGIQKCVWSSSKGAHRRRHLAPPHTSLPTCLQASGFCPHCPAACCILAPNQSKPGVTTEASDLGSLCLPLLEPGSVSAQASSSGFLDFSFLICKMEGPQPPPCARS